MGRFKIDRAYKKDRKAIVKTEVSKIRRGNRSYDILLKKTWLKRLKTKFQIHCVFKHYLKNNYIKKTIHVFPNPCSYYKNARLLG